MVLEERLYVETLSITRRKKSGSSSWLTASVSWNVWITPRGRCRVSKLRHQAEVPRPFSEGRAYMGGFPSLWKGSDGEVDLGEKSCAANLCHV